MRISERRSVFSVEIRRADWASRGWMSSRYDQRCGTGLGPLVSWLMSSCALSPRAQNGNMCLRSICSYMDSNSAARASPATSVACIHSPLNGYQDSAEQNLITTNGCVNAILVFMENP